MGCGIPKTIKPEKSVVDIKGLKMKSFFWSDKLSIRKRNSSGLASYLRMIQEAPIDCETSIQL